jgi:hypothetical protein
VAFVGTKIAKRMATNFHKTRAAPPFLWQMDDEDDGLAIIPLKAPLIMVQLNLTGL